MKHILMSAMTLALAIPAASQSQIRKPATTPQAAGILTPLPIPGVPPRRAVVLNAVPDSMLRLRQWPTLTIRRVPPAAKGAIASAGATIYVGKYWFNKPRPRSGEMCSAPDLARDQWYLDELDLSLPRSHGFRLLDVTITPAPLPEGYVATKFAGPDRGDDDVAPQQSYRTADRGYTHVKADAVYVPLQAPTAQRYSYPGIPVQCFLGYRVNVTLIGPADVDPFTGKAFARQRTVN